MKNLAKLTPPRLPKIVERTRLYRELDRARNHHSIIWITAPPGMGKTTLVASYLKARGLRCLWYQADEGDADPATFFHYLGLASKKTAPRYRQPLPHLTPEYLPGLPMFTRRFFETLYVRLKAPTIVVFDNYQQIPRANPVQDLLEIGLQLLPSGCSAIILSREEPPPAMARLQANQALTIFDAEILKLTSGEAKHVVQLHTVARKAKGRRLHVEKSLELARGWIGGLVLLLKDVDIKVPARLDESEHISEMLFNYLARETLHRLPDKTQTLLLTSSIFPFFTNEMAERLSGNATGKEQLNRLYQSGYFIERRVGTLQTYQYHPLFRSFLLTTLQKAWSLKELSKLKTKAGLLLKEMGWEEEAVGVLQAAEAFEELVEVILAQAPQMLAQGRGKTLEQWIRNLPQNVIDRNPWVNYWLGNSLITRSSENAQKIFKDVFEQFQNLGEQRGALLAWCGYAEATLFHWEDISILDHWIEQFPFKDVTELNHFESSMQATVYASMFMTLFWRRQHDPDIHWWYGKTVKLLTEFDDPFQAIRVAFTLATFNCQLGRVDVAWDIFHRLETWTRNRHIPVSIRVHMNNIKGVCAFFSGDLESCLDLLRENEAIGEKEGYFMGVSDSTQGVYVNLVLDDIPSAQQCAKKLQPIMEHLKGFAGGHYHFFMAWLWINVGDLERAHQYAERALQEVTKLKTHYPIGECELAVAHIKYEMGDEKIVWKHLRHANKCAESIKSPLLQFKCLLTEAYFLLKSQKQEAAIKPLREAMRMGRNYNQTVTSFWRPKVMAMLCAEALKHNIEVTYVRNLIRQRSLVPEESPLSISNWPWPVKVTTLGKFEIVVNDQPVTFGRKIPRRVLALLQALIACGGADVPELTLIDALWPEADGDRAYRSYATTLHRLRKLLGDEKTIIVQDSKITLNADICWVDVWAFERLLDQATQADEAGESVQGRDLRKQARQLYSGPFLGDDAEKPWATRTRERLRKRWEAQLALVTKRSLELKRA